LVLACYCTKDKLKNDFFYVGKMPNLNGRCFQEVDVELIPRTLAERCRSAQRGSTYPQVTEPKWPKAKKFTDSTAKMHVMEHAFNADFAIVKAWKEIRPEFNI
jgi:acyl CoA:acetate/3-ketoacid CoA transferase alpha subunit